MIERHGAPCEVGHPAGHGAQSRFLSKVSYNITSFRTKSAFAQQHLRNLSARGDFVIFQALRGDRLNNLLA